jgi:hypothetical protein
MGNSRETEKQVGVQRLATSSSNICHKPNSTLSEIARAVAQSPLIFAAIVETLENQGEIDVQRGLGVELQISGVHAALLRRVQEACS